MLVQILTDIPHHTLYISGIIYDHTKTYKIPFLLAGIPPIVGSIALLLVRCVKSEAHDDAEIEDKQLQVVGMDGATEAVKLSVIANGDSTTLLPTYQDLTAGMWIKILSTSATTPIFIPECQRLITEPRNYCSLNYYTNRKLHSYGYSIL